uniref:Uncharacterized protein n=1 Tax=Papilio xuthus TaxID=66420 RepID=I4DLR8_PAPXU|nr:unknown unsecreted protein [Papilio xuthus]
MLLLNSPKVSHRPGRLFTLHLDKKRCMRGKIKPWFKLRKLNFRNVALLSAPDCLKITSDLY